LRDLSEKDEETKKKKPNWKNIDQANALKMTS
jgi:hypothetical protein